MHKLLILLLITMPVNAEWLRVNTPTQQEDGSIIIPGNTQHLAGIDFYICNNIQPYSTVYTSDPGIQVLIFIGTTLNSRCFEAKAFDDTPNYSVISNRVNTRKIKCYKCHDGQM